MQPTALALCFSQRRERSHSKPHRSCEGISQAIIPGQVRGRWGGGETPEVGFFSHALPL